MTTELNPITQQPILPAEKPLTDAEWSFIAEEPPKFFPGNQDSNWGLLRRIFSDWIQLGQDQLDLIWAERFAQTSSQFLDEWEREVGLPMNPPNQTLQQRRDAVLARLRKGPFTRTQRRNIVESYLFSLAYGEPIKLFPPGVDLGPEGGVAGVPGVPIYGEPGLVKDMYRIYEDIPRFRYNVCIDSDFTPDVFALQRDLDHFTPAGITRLITTGKPSPLNYEWETYDMLEPNGFWKLNDVASTGTLALDYAYDALHGTYSGAYTLDNLALLVNDQQPAINYISAGSVIDNFNRADQGPPMTGWTTWIGSWAVRSNQAKNIGGVASTTYYSSASYPFPSGVSVKVSTLPPSGQQIQIGLGDPTGGGTDNWYKVVLSFPGGNANISINRVINGTISTLGGTATTFLAGDDLGIFYDKSKVTAWRRSGGQWFKVIEGTDNTHANLTTVRPILMASEGTAAVDDLTILTSVPIAARPSKNVLLAGGRIQVPDHPRLDLGDNWCFECWFKRTAAGVNGYLVSKGVGAFFVQVGGDQIRVAIPGGVLLAHSSNYLDNSLYYLVVQKAGSNVKIYINAVDQTVVDSAGTCVSTSTPLWIGDDGFNSSTFQGNIGYVSLSQNWLTPEQIQQRYNTGRDILTG
jgi:hypothetical protein